MNESSNPATWRMLWMIFLCIVLSACQDSKSRENEQLRQEITQVHDLAMAEIETMYILRMRLKNLSEPPDKNRAANQKQCLADLHHADESMFAWMRQYQPLSVASDISVDTQYRIAQLAQIKAVQDLMERVMNKARACLADAEGKTAPASNA